MGSAEIEQRKAYGLGREADSIETKLEIEATLSLEGCLALGDDENRNYFTKHSIDYNAQNSQIAKTILATEHLSCCCNRRNVTFSHALGALRSDISLYCLHLIVISLGVIKESVVVHGGEPTDTARLVYTSVETASTVIVVVVRTANAWTAFSSAGNEIDRMGFVRGRVAAPAWRALVRFFRLVSVAGGCLVVVCLASFVVCLTVEQLEWTVLSNVVCIITVNLLYALFTVRITRTLCWIRTDAYRLVAYEAVGMLKSQNQSAMEETAEKEEDERINLPRAFVSAFESTPMFQIPGYIGLRKVESVEKRYSPASRSNGVEPIISNGLGISEACSDVSSFGSNSIAWNTYL